jgi:hypothetical protein
VSSSKAAVRNVQLIAAWKRFFMDDSPNVSMVLVLTYEFPEKPDTSVHVSQTRTVMVADSLLSGHSSQNVVFRRMPIFDER